MRISDIILISVLGLLMCGCYSSIDLDEYRNEEGENMLVLNSVICPDSIIAVSATPMLYYINTDRNLIFPPIDTLDIHITINGEDKGIMTYNVKKSWYQSSIKPLPGDRVEMSTYYRGKQVKTSCIVPMQVEVLNIETIVERTVNIQTPYDMTITYKITFKDNPHVNDYYYLGIDNPKQLGLQIYLNYTYDYVFTHLSQYIASGNPGWEPWSRYGLPFSDADIDGETYTLTIQEIVYSWDPNPYWNPDTEIERRVKLYAINEDYYLYQVGLLRAYEHGDGLTNGLFNLGLASPTKIHSNIDGGCGIFGSYTSSMHWLTIKL